MRYAIWTAVSSKQQAAEDKVSLSEQENKCRAAAAARGWRETSGPYIVPGQSRTRWINLRDAEAEMPPLHAMLEDAQRGAYDLLILYDYTRLRELLDPVARALSAYGVQLFSISQPVEPVPPAGYDPYATDAASIVQTVSGLTSRAEINALRRRYRIGVPRRVTDKGLHPIGRKPYGYRRPPGRELDASAPLIPDPVTSLHVIAMKDLYLSGWSVPQIIDHLEQQGIRPRSGSPRWSDYSVRFILKNPFYAGIVTFGRTRKVRDPRTGAVKQIPNDPAAIQSAPGQHTPLWDEATHNALLAEHKRRHKRYKGQKTYRLSLLLYCPIHNRPLYVKYHHGRRVDEHRVWYCPAGEKGHWHLHIKDSAALEQLRAQIITDFHRLENIPLPEHTTDTDSIERAIEDLQKRKERLLDALELGSLDPETYAQRIAPLDRQLATVKQQHTETQQRAANHAARKQGLSQLAQALQTAPLYIIEAPAPRVNTQLRQLIHRIYVTDTGLQIEYN